MWKTCLNPRNISRLRNVYRAFRWKKKRWLLSLRETESSSAIRITSRVKVGSHVRRKHKYKRKLKHINTHKKYVWTGTTQTLKRKHKKKENVPFSCACACACVAPVHICFSCALICLCLNLRLACVLTCEPALRLPVTGTSQYTDTPRARGILSNAFPKKALRLRWHNIYNFSFDLFLLVVRSLVLRV